MILGLRTAIYPVNDLVKAKEWYSQVLGIKPYFDQPFFVGFQVGGFELGLLPQGQASIAGPQPLWGVANIEEAFQGLLDLGAESLELITDVGDGIKVAAVKDPFGNRLGIIENPHFNPREVK
jgi:catechol 2,3-dioxygenase-like lactoylglutathione lyase family enzyme